MILRQQDFRRVTNHASRGQEVRDEARVRDRAPQTARSDTTEPNVPNTQIKLMQTFKEGTGAGVGRRTVQARKSSDSIMQHIKPTGVMGAMFFRNDNSSWSGK